MENTIQLYSDREKKNKVYPITSPDRVIDEHGISIKSQLDNMEIIKADKTTTNNIQQQVNNLVLGAVGDGNNAEVIQARGKFTTLNGRLDFMDSSHLKNISANLVNSHLSKGVNTNGVTIEKLDEITYKATCTQSWGGTFNNRIKVSPNKFYMVICKVKASDENSVGKYCSRTTYQYSVNNTNLGNSSLVYSDYSQTRITLTNDYKYIYYCETPNHEDVDYIDFGITGVPNSSFIVTECVILDVTNLTLEEIKAIDFVNREYWHNYIENFNISNYSLKAEESVIALDLKEDVKNSLITNTSELAIKESNIYTDWKIAKVLAMPFIEESNKLAWTKKEMSTGSSVGWWIQNNTTSLEPNSTYLYTVKMKTNTNVVFNRCCELRNGAWYNDSTVTISSIGSIPFIAKTWIFKTDDKVTSPILCCVTNNETLTDNLTLEVELFRVIDEQYTTNQFCTELVQVYHKDKNVNDFDFSNRIKWGGKEQALLSNKWRGKNALVIGDSITAAGQWQKKLNEDLGINVTTHAKGGIGIIAMVDGDKGLGGDYDNETNASGTIYPLDTDKVKDKDLIVVLPAYNERGREYGQIGDLYPAQTTIIGMMQYQINRIYEELTKADNLNCKVLIATPHCAGAYNYNYIDGYGEYPANSGRTMQTLSNTIKEICNYNNIPVCDLWHNSGINKFTWNIYGANSYAVNENYTKYKLNEQGEAVEDTPLRYVKGNSYYQLRDGQVVLEEYTGLAPYPFCGDQLHCSSLGYARIGECIVGSIIKSYGY